MEFIKLIIFAIFGGVMLFIAGLILAGVNQSLTPGSTSSTQTVTAYATATGMNASSNTAGNTPAKANDNNIATYWEGNLQ